MSVELFDQLHYNLLSRVTNLENGTGEAGGSTAAVLVDFSKPNENGTYFRIDLDTYEVEQVDWYEGILYDGMNVNRYTIMISIDEASYKEFTASSFITMAASLDPELSLSFSKFVTQTLGGVTVAAYTVPAGGFLGDTPIFITLIKTDATPEETGMVGNYVLANTVDF